MFPEESRKDQESAGVDKAKVFFYYPQGELFKFNPYP